MMSHFARDVTTQLATISQLQNSDSFVARRIYPLFSLAQILLFVIDIVISVPRGSTRLVGTSPLVAAQQRTGQLFSAPEIRQTDLGAGAWGQPTIIRILTRYRTESHGPKLSLKT